jgi:putative membrane protein
MRSIARSTAILDGVRARTVHFQSRSWRSAGHADRPCRAPCRPRARNAVVAEDGERRRDYQWIKAFHIIAVIAWMAGMLYLPRLFVYHCAAEKGSVQSETFKVMERRLLRAIINPAMIATWLLGLGLAWLGLILATAGSLRAGCRPSSCWFWLLSAMHGFLARWVKDFAADRNPHSEIL